MGGIASQITSLTVVYSTVYSGADQENIKARVTGLCVGNSPGTGEFPAQMATNAETVSIWWRHHVSPHITWLRCKQHTIFCNYCGITLCRKIINILSPGQRVPNFANGILKCIFLRKAFWNMLQPSLKYVPGRHVENKYVPLPWFPHFFRNEIQRLFKGLFVDKITFFKH